MKKIIITISAALLTLAACNKIDAPAERIVPEDGVAPALHLNFTVSLGDADTKAVKTAVEEGDKVYVFFDSTIPSRDQYLTLTYTGGAWMGAWKGGLENDLAKKTSGTLAAIYIPFADDTEISINPLTNSPSSITRGTAWFINPTKDSKAVYSYFRSCVGTAYSIANNTVTATLHLGRPAGYDFVHIFVPGLTSVDGRYTMKTDPELKGANVVAYKPGEGFIAEEADNFPGYAYGGSVCFSGFLPSGLAGTSADYKFKLYDNGGSPDDGADDNAFIYTVSGKSLSAKSAIALPQTSSWKSMAYGEDATLRAIPMCELNGQTLYFANINLGATSLADRPSCYGSKYQWAGTTAYPYDKYYEDFAVEGAYGNYYHAPYYLYDSYSFKKGYTKYVSVQAAAYDEDPSYVDNKEVLDPEDDAATVVLGAPWRIPTGEEWQALIDNCQWTFDTPNNGWKIVGRGAYSSSVMFLPMTGERQGEGDEYFFTDVAFYQASTMECLDLYHDDLGGFWINVYGNGRYNPYSVRAVRTSPL